MKILYIFFVSVLLMAAACTPVRTPLIATQADSESIFWLDGKALMADSTDGIRIYVGYEAQTGNRLSFWVWCYNGSSRSFTLDPAAFKLLVNDMEARQRRRPDLFPTARWARNPEVQIALYDTRIASQERHIRTSSALNAGVAFLDMMGSILEIADKDKDREAAAQRQQERERNNVRSSIDHQNNLAQLEQLKYDRERYAGSVLRRNTLLPGQSLSGRVEIGRMDHARAFTVTYPMQSCLLQYAFAQRVVR